MVKETYAARSVPLDKLNKALEEKRPYIQDGILSWAKGNLTRYPWRQHGRTPYEVLVGEMWLKITSSTVATGIYNDFLSHFSSFQSLVEARDDEISNALSSFDLRYYARFIKVAANKLYQERREGLPLKEVSLIKLSGLDHHQVKIVFCFGYGIPMAITEANIERMQCRIFGDSLPPESPHSLLQAIAENLLPCRNPYDYNRAILDIATILCREENPVCTKCPVKEVCDSAPSFFQLNLCLDYAEVI